ncbi:MAG: tRNA glutamyl-Q(34) synthetase GluQRS [Polyangiaceae bacterium]|nr:tRNA glutamyl-Q(34) synthetase GluQRS [Polyangiaceae bacterium]
MTYRGRFAPSPTGDLHLGSAVAAVFCAAAALAARGTLVLRVEDIDTPRVIPGQAARIAEDLDWLGIRFQEGPDIGGAAGPYVQSQRQALYEAAIDELAKHDLVYLCDCSRAEIARVASAPHAGDEGPRYSGTCRPFGMRPRAFKRPPAVRIAVPHDARSIVTTNDLVLGSRTDDVADVTGDFVLRRGDGIFAYQLAVVVDDLAMGITDVVRGADLAGSSARQVLLARLLGGEPPAFAHVPLLVADDGRRLAKRDGGMTIREQRAFGRDPRELVRTIARAYGHDIAGSAEPLEALAEALEWSKLPMQPVRVGALGRST